MFGGKKERPPEDDDKPPPFRWADVEARLTRAKAVHDGERAAWSVWAPILASLQAEQQRMRDRGLW